MKNKYVTVGLILILILVLVSVLAAAMPGKSWHGRWAKTGEHHGDESDWPEKLGLPSDASKEEVKEAIQAWKEENNHPQRFKRGFSKQSWCGNL